MTYTKRNEGDFRYPTPIPPGAAVPFCDGVVFKCPCGKRQVYVASPPHTITFDDAGLLNLDGSVGSKEQMRLSGEAPHDNDEWRSRGPNWCHFWIENGESRMADDAKCPGGNE